MMIMACHYYIFFRSLLFLSFCQNWPLIYNLFYIFFKVCLFNLGNAYCCWLSLSLSLSLSVVKWGLLLLLSTYYLFMVSWSLIQLVTLVILILLLYSFTLHSLYLIYSFYIFVCVIQFLSNFSPLPIKHTAHTQTHKKPTSITQI